MNSLLNFALDAHGGLSRWSQFHTVEATLSIGGALWQMKSRPRVLEDIRVEGMLQEQQLTTHLVGQNRRMVFLPEYVAVETESGDLLAERDNPRSSFEGQQLTTPWDDLHVNYFSSYALWNYLTIPFLYTYPGVATEELLAWHENGEEWMPLKVTFPASLASHTTEQISYFGPDGLLRKHEYTVDVLGGARGVNYAHGHLNVQGIIVPTVRRAYAYDAKKQRIPEPILVAIDIHEIRFY